MRPVKVAFFLAIKSIVRGNGGVTLLTISILMIANLNLLFVPSLVNGIVHSANGKLIDVYSSDIIIESSTDSPYIRNSNELVNSITKIDGVIGATYRNSLSAELDYNDLRTTATIRGVDPELEKQVFKIADAMVEGSYLEPRELDKIVLGIQLSGSDRKDLELYSSSLRTVHAGDKITVKYANGVQKQYEVKGIFYTEFLQTDMQAFVTEQEFKSVNPLVGDRAAVINVKIKNESYTPRIIGEIAKLQAGLRFKTWQDTAGIILSMTNSFDIINGILAVVNLLVAGITIFIVTYIDLVNKRRQIGIERAIGINPGAITLSYILRALFYASTAAIIAYFLYLYGVVPLEMKYPFHFPFGDITLFLSRELVVRSAIIILSASLVGSFLPVLRTIRMKLLDAIWG